MSAFSFYIPRGNPGIIDQADVASFRDAGDNRITVGIQSFQILTATNHGAIGLVSMMRPRAAPPITIRKLREKFVAPSGKNRESFFRSVVRQGVDS